MHSQLLISVSVGQIATTDFGSGPIICIRHSNETRIDSLIKSIVFYQIALPYGKAFICEDSIISISDSTESDGVCMDLDEQPLTQEFKSPLQSTSQSSTRTLFSTEAVYIFTRLYIAIAKILIKVQSRLSDGNTNMAESSSTKSSNMMQKEMKVGSFTDFIRHMESVIVKLQSADFDRSEIENMCRHFANDEVYLLSSLPDLIERCLTSLSDIVDNQDTILSLFKYCSKESSVGLIAIHDCSY